MMTYRIAVSFDFDGLNAVILALNESIERHTRNDSVAAMIAERDRLTAMRDGDLLNALYVSLRDNPPGNQKTGG